MTAPWLCTPNAAMPAIRRRAIGVVETGTHPLDPDRVAVYRLPPDMGATT